MLNSNGLRPYGRLQTQNAIVTPPPRGEGDIGGEVLGFVAAIFRLRKLKIAPLECPPLGGLPPECVPSFAGRGFLYIQKTREQALALPNLNFPLVLFTNRTV